MTVIDRVAFVDVKKSFEKTIPLWRDRSMHFPFIFTMNLGSYKKRADSISVIAVAFGRCLLTKVLILVPCPALSQVVCLIILNGASP